MVNLNYQKVIQSCKNYIDKNPYVAKAVLVHLIIVVLLYILSYISVLKFDSNAANLQAQISNAPKKIQVIQATSISSTELNKQVQAYENHQQKLAQARDDVRKARKQALEKHKVLMKQKAEAAKRAKLEAKRKAVLEAKRKAEEKVQQEKQKKLEQQKKAEQEKQAKLEADRKQKELDKKKAQEEAKRKQEQEKKAKQEAERKAREQRLAKARAEAEAAARKQIAQNQAQSAISSYIAEYQDRVGANWIKDSCRGIYNLPRAIIKNGRFIKLTGTSGNYQCDQSLIDAIKNTTPPDISNGVARKTIQSENISFIFKQS